ncbi:Uncharacterised protein [Mycobacteroides abscessus subsp. abscessus]|nr:Uncharacterised protein [Mycobacteroides abscessus subsp. abscessus]
MSDPAVEAAQRSAEAIERARRERCPREDWVVAPTAYPREVAAAREALAPIREWYENPGTTTLASLIYTSEELER